MNKYEVINQYEKLCKIIETATLEGNFKVVDKTGQKLFNLFDKMLENMEETKEILKMLLKSKNVSARSYAAVNCLKWNTYVNSALKVLKKISKNKRLGILSLNAEMVLKVYNGEISNKKL